MSSPDLIPPTGPEPVSRRNAVVVFLAVAAMVLLPLFLVARFASGESAPAVAELTLAAETPTPPPAVEALVAVEPTATAVPAQPTATPEPVVEVAPPPTPSPTPEPPRTPPPAVGANAYTVMERSCGAVLAGLKEHERLPPASLTKIITALVVMDRASLDSQVNIKVSAKELLRRGSSVMGIEPGMRLSVRDLLYGLFLPSGNDAALALATYVSDDVPSFADLMNQKAQSLQLNDSHFLNPHGLDAPYHFSSTYDMAIAGRALLDNPVLAQISRTPSYQPDWPGARLENGNQLLKRYPGAFGVKIGYTNQAHQTIVAAVERDGRQVIVSLFGSDDRYSDSIALFNWVFANTQSPCPVG